MIKAEVISHEGNPGPNWLDHCKTLMTPWVISVVIAAVAILLVLAISSHRREVGQANQLPTSSSSQQTAHLVPLTVTSVASVDNITQAATDTSVQASAATTAAQSASVTTASVLGAKSTPNLNTAKNSSSAADSNNTSNPNNISTRQLSQTVQTTVTESTQTAQDTVKSVTSLLH